MNKIIICILLLASVSSAQVKQFIWKVGADGKAIPYYQNGKNINLDSAGVYSKTQVDSLIDYVTPDTAAYIASHHFVDSSSALRVKYSDTVSTITTKHKSDSSVATREASLGNPSSNGMVLSSTTSGGRSWIVDTVYQFYSVTASAGSINSLRYTTLGGGLITSDTIKTVFPMDVTVDRMYVWNRSANSGTSTGYVRLLKNGVNTGVTTGGWQSGQLQSDLTHSASFAAGVDRVSFEVSPGTGTVDNVTITFRARVK